MILKIDIGMLLGVTLDFGRGGRRRGGICYGCLNCVHAMLLKWILFVMFVCGKRYGLVLYGIISVWGLVLDLGNQWTDVWEEG